MTEGIGSIPEQLDPGSLLPGKQTVGNSMVVPFIGLCIVTHRSYIRIMEAVVLGTKLRKKFKGGIGLGRGLGHGVLV